MKNYFHPVFDAADWATGTASSIVKKFQKVLPWSWRSALTWGNPEIMKYERAVSIVK